MRRKLVRMPRLFTMNSAQIINTVFGITTLLTLGIVYLSFTL